MESRKPLCPYFGLCGGCSGQHIPYEAQLNNKKHAVIAEFERLHIPMNGEIPVFSDKEYEYRNRMDFSFSADGIGLREKGRYDSIIPIERCVISNGHINGLLQELWQWFREYRNKVVPFDVRKNTGVLKYALIRASEFADSKTVSFVLNAESSAIQNHIEYIREFANKTTAQNVTIALVKKEYSNAVSEQCFAVKGDIAMIEKLEQNEIIFSSQSFFQNNSKMAVRMIAYCKEILERHQTKDAVLIDLFGGAGTFGISLQDFFSETVILDKDTQNIAYAKQNIARNNLRSMSVKDGDAASIKTIVPHGKKRIFLITDPPRIGMGNKTLQRLLELQPEMILYVSCNPKQLAKEVKILGKKYSMESLAVFDLFPQTPHIEAIAELKLKKELT